MADPRSEIAMGRLTGIYGAPNPKDWPVTTVDDPVELEARAARQEMADLPDLPYPSTANVMANHPGVLGYQVMTDPEYQQAVKYDNLMRRLEAIKSDRGGMAFRESPTAGLLTGGTYKPEPMRDRSFWGEYWKSKPHSGTEQLPPYRHRGVLASGQPLRNALELWQVPFSAVSNTAIRPWYDLDKAAAAAPEVANKAFAGIPRAIRAVTEPGYEGEINQDWADEQRFVENQRFDGEPMLATKGNPANLYRAMQTGSTPGIVEGPEILGELGYPEHWSRDLLGIMGESVLDPMSGYGAVAKGIGGLGRSGARAQALRTAAGGLASEATPAASMAALLEVLRRAQQSQARE